LLEHRTESTERIVDELLEATRRFSEGALLHDDLTIVVAKAK
jgi:serine phosphatase RsbU (regulator of sigma subunit)